MAMTPRTIRTPRRAASVSALGLALVLLALPAGGRAEARGAGPGQAADQGKKRPSRFQIELYGGASALNPADLNRFVDYDNRIQEFFYDSCLAFRAGSGDIRFWGVRREGERAKIQTGLPFGLRLRYRWNASLAASVGLKYISGRRSNDIRYDYSQTMTWGDVFTESGRFAPYTLSAAGWAPLAGLHFMHRLSSALSIEASLAGGPLFARCLYLSDWNYALTIAEYVNPAQGNGTPYEAFSRAGHLEEEGTGTGLALEAGLRLDWSWGDRWGIFAEAGYARQRAKRISGRGREVNGADSSSWEGAWAIQSEDIATYWGETRLEFPTNYWPQGSESRRSGDFSLDFSGVQVRVGILFRL